MIAMAAVPTHGKAFHSRLGLVRASERKHASGVHRMQDFVRVLKSAMGAYEPYGKDAGMTVLAHADEEETAKNLRFSPKWHKLSMKVFTRLDKNGDGELLQWEFTSMVPEQDAELLTAGRELFGLFAPDQSMTRKEFLRFVCVTVLPDSGFEWHSGDMAVMNPKHPKDRADLMKLFSVFDPHSDAAVSLADFEQGYTGKLLWKLREEGLETSGLMYSSDEFNYGKKKFNTYAADGKLPLVAFVKLLEECKKEALLNDWKQQKNPSVGAPPPTYASARRGASAVCGAAALAALLLGVIAA